MTNKDRVKWIEALRSGKYKQGKGQLKQDDRYCCLGVLQEITNCDLDLRNQTEKLSYDFLYGGHQNLLIEMNDCRNKNFNEIADWIEKHL